ncbi:ribosome biogenesis GTPase Der [Lachnospiraceae bacterium oral taxon 500]|nr:ribosome biogenesis GTPase Der [Lachnospiraceae bacterium oral taxon 500]
MGKPIVAVVGRPNVGKSTLFNYLAGKRISIVQDTPGVTRDRIYADTEWLDRTFTLIDTGGLELSSSDTLLKHIRAQAEIAIDLADVILFIADGRAGVTDADYEVANLLRKSKKPIILCVNKVDSFQKQANDIYEFYNLGLGEPIPVSAANQQGFGELLDAVTAYFPQGEKEEAEEYPSVALVGKPNVGKSSLLNQLLGEERSIVSDVAGTTRDSIDSVVTYNHTKYVFTDTAGLRRKNKVTGEIEKYSIIRTVAAVEKSDITLLMIDATEGLTEQDAKIAGIAHERGKGIIIAVNKWDAIEKDDKTMKRFEEDIQRTLSYLDYAPRVFISAKTGQRMHRLFETIEAVVQNQNLRVATGVLNEVLYDAMAMNQPPADKGNRLKIFYATQVGVKPPTFVLFINERELMHFSYQRYIENKFREAFGFKGTSLRFILKERKKND